jgi:1,4-alpha-glucan branching enzyme
MAKREKRVVGETGQPKQGPRSAPGKKRHQFLYEASDATSVRVTGSFCDWADGYALKKDKKGVWKASVSLRPGRYEYRFVVDGEWRDDPKARERVRNAYGGENAIVEL